MNSRLRPFVDISPQENVSTIKQEVDRIPGTTKIRTYCANASLYSQESSMEQLLKRAELCTDGSGQN